MSEPKKMGPPTIDFDWAKLDKLLELGPKLTDAAELLGVSEDTIERRIRERHDLTYAEYRCKKQALVRKSLVSTAYALAMGLPPHQGKPDKTLLIFCLKNLCGWSDNNNDQNVEQLQPIILKYSLEEKQVS